MLVSPESTTSLDTPPPPEQKEEEKAIVWNENPLHKDKDKDKGEKGGLELSQMSAGAGEEDCVPPLLRQHEQSIIPACLFYPPGGLLRTYYPQ